MTTTMQVLRDLCGYIENGGGCTVKIYQDDATRSWHIEVGNCSYYGDSLEDAIHKAHKVHYELVPPIEEAVYPKPRPNHGWNQ